MRTQSSENSILFFFLHARFGCHFVQECERQCAHKRTPSINYKSLLFSISHHNYQSTFSTFILHLPFPNAQAVIFQVLCCGMKTVDHNGQTCFSINPYSFNFCFTYIHQRGEFLCDIIRLNNDRICSCKVQQASNQGMDEQ